MNFVESYTILDIDSKQIPCITGSGAPTSSTEGAVGSLYMNTTNGTVYKCTSSSSSSRTWKTIVTDYGADISEKTGGYQYYITNADDFVDFCSTSNQFTYGILVFQHDTLQLPATGVTMPSTRNLNLNGKTLYCPQDNCYLNGTLYNGTITGKARFSNQTTILKDCELFLDDAAVGMFPCNMTSCNVYFENTTQREGYTLASEFGTYDACKFNIVFPSTVFGYTAFDKGTLKNCDITVYHLLGAQAVNYVIPTIVHGSVTAKYTKTTLVAAYLQEPTVQYYM